MKGINATRTLSVGVLLLGLYAMSVWLSDLFVLPTLIGLLGPIVVKRPRWAQVGLPAVVPAFAVLMLWPWYEFTGLVVGSLVMSVYIGVVAAIVAKGVAITLQSNDRLKSDARESNAP